MRSPSKRERAIARAFFMPRPAEQGLSRASVSSQDDARTAGGAFLSIPSLLRFTRQRCMICARRAGLSMKPSPENFPKIMWLFFFTLLAWWVLVGKLRQPKPLITDWTDTFKRFPEIESEAVTDADIASDQVTEMLVNR